MCVWLHDLILTMTLSALGVRPLPVSVTVVPPALDPLLGVTLQMAGRRRRRLPGSPATSTRALPRLLTRTATYSDEATGGGPVVEMENVRLSDVTAETSPRPIDPKVTCEKIYEQSSLLGRQNMFVLTCLFVYFVAAGKHALYVRVRTQHVNVASVSQTRPPPHSDTVRHRSPGQSGQRHHVWWRYVG